MAFQLVYYSQQDSRWKNDILGFGDPGDTIGYVGCALDSVATLYDLQRGSNGTIRYEFTSGQVFQFGATGNWFSPEGATNTFTFTVTVE